MTKQMRNAMLAERLQRDRARRDARFAEERIRRDAYARGVRDGNETLRGALSSAAADYALQACADAVGAAVGQQIAEKVPLAVWERAVRRVAGNPMLHAGFSMSRSSSFGEMAVRVVVELDRIRFAMLVDERDMAATKTAAL